MNLADLLIIVVLVVSVVSAFVKGFFVEVFSLAGLILGLFFAAANYGAFAPWVLRVIQNREVANLIAFLAIALLVMVVGGTCRSIASRIVPRSGLGYRGSITGCGLWVG